MRVPDPTKIAPSKVIPGRYEKNEKHNNSFQTRKSGSKPRTIQHLASIKKKPECWTNKSRQNLENCRETKTGSSS
jgi:hypothetical protein